MKIAKLLAVSYLVTAVVALPQHYEGLNYWTPMRLDLMGSYGGQSFLQIPAGTYANIDITPTNIFYRSYWFVGPTNQTLTLSNRFPVSGTFQFKTITATLTLYPFLHARTNMGPAVLTWTRESLYSIAAQPGFGSPTLRGEYQVRGPNETASGNFNVTFSAPSRLPHDRMDAAGYPRAVALLGNPALSGGGSIFSGVVDGVQIDIMAQSFGFEGNPGIGLSRAEPLRAWLKSSPLELCWNSLPDLMYQVEHRSHLTGFVWTPLGPLVRGNGGTNCVGQLPPANPGAFFRVREFPDW